MNEPDPIALLAGQIDALFAVTCTLISTSSDGPLLLERLTNMTQARQAKNEAQQHPHPMPEEFLIGYHDMRDRLLKFAKKSLASGRTAE